MELKQPLYTTPVPSTQFVTEAYWNGKDSSICFTYERNGVEYLGRIRFEFVAAVRERAERCCTVWHIGDVYDTLAEIVNSSWVSEVRADTDKHWRDKWKMHHYMIYFDSVGCFEILARSWVASDEEATAL